MDKVESRSERVNELADEFVERFRRGERPSISQYVERFPEAEREIREVLSALVHVERLAPSSRDVFSQKLGSESPQLEQLGDFRIVREVGRGGMGIVYEAEQLSLGRRVALKVLPTQALLDTNYKKRFVREAKAAARLHHTNIVPVFGVGEDGGLQYYAMQFIHGLGLDEVLAELRRLRRPLEAPPGEGSGRGPEDVPHAASAEDVANSLLTGCFQKTLVQPVEFDNDASTVLRGTSPINEESASLQDNKVAGQTSSFTLSDSLHLPGHSTDGKRSSNSAYHQSVARIGIQAAQALQHAHSQGILHRDIKPSNLLLDTQGTLWVTDFGLAKHLPSAEGDGVEQAPDITGTGDIVGTLRYLPPEAFSGKSDARSDIFSLGLTLYELLALKPAYDETDRRKLVKQVTHEAPESLYKMDISIPKDLITIVHKAIERDPADRFQTAEELAKDLDRFLNDEPIRARRISIPARFGRWCKRNKTIAGLVGMIFILLLGAAVTSVIASASYRQVATAKGQALDDLEREKQHTEEALTNEVSARQSEKIRLAELELMRGRGLCERGFVAEGLHWMARGLATAESAGVSANPLEEAIRHNLDAWQNRLCRLRQACNVEQMNPTTTSQQSYALADDGKTLLIGVSREGVFPYDLARGQLIQRRLDLNEKPFSTILLHPDAELLIVKFSKKVEPGKWIGQVRIWNRLTGEDIATISHPESSIKAVALDADHDRLATADENGEIRLWDIRTGKRLAPTIKFPINTARHVPAILLAFSPDGKRLLAAGKLTAQLWDPETGQPLGEPLEHPAGNFVRHVEFSPDGRRAVTVTNQPYLWDVESCRQIAALGHAESLTTWKIAFSPDGKILAAGNSKDRFAYLWATEDGAPVGKRLMHDGGIDRIRFSPNGKWILTASGTSAQLWSVPTEDHPESREVGQPVKHDGSIRILEYLPDGKSFVTATAKAVRIWELPIGDQFVSPRKNQSSIVKVDFWPDDVSLAIAGGHGGGTVAVFKLPKGGSRNSTPYPAQDAAFAARGDGYVVASALLPDTRNAGPGGFYLFPLGVHYQRIRQQPVPPNVFYKKTFYKATPGLPYDVALSHDGTRLVTVLQRYDVPLHEVSLWEVSFAPPQAKLLSAQTHRSAVRAEFHPEGDYFVTYSPEEGIIERWDAESGHALGTLIQVKDWIKCVAFSPDGKLLATGSKTQATVRDAQTGEPRFRPIPHRGSVTAIAFSPDGKLITGSTDLGIRVWDPATGLQLGPTLYHEGEIWSLAVSRNGKLIASGSKDKTARVWRVPQRMPASSEEIRLRMDVNTGLELTKDGSLRVLDAEAWQKKQDQLKRTPVRTNPDNKEKKTPEVPEN